MLFVSFGVARVTPLCGPQMAAAAVSASALVAPTEDEAVEYFEKTKELSERIRGSFPLLQRIYYIARAGKQASSDDVDKFLEAAVDAMNLKSSSATIKKLGAEYAKQLSSMGKGIKDGDSDTEIRDKQLRQTALNYIAGYCATGKPPAPPSPVGTALSDHDFPPPSPKVYWLADGTRIERSESPPVGC